MKVYVPLLAAVALSLSGCQDETQDREAIAQATDGSGNAELYFAYPTRGQNNVPLSTPFFLRFNGSIDTPPENIADALQLRGPDGDIVPLENIAFTKEQKGLRARPGTELKPGRQYRLAISGLEVDGSLFELDQAIEFTTSPTEQGPITHRLDVRSDGSRFEVARILPYSDSATPEIGQGSNDFPVTDLSSFRLQFSEPVRASSVQYGDTLRVTDGKGNLIGAEVFVDGHRMTIDPDANLTPGETYTLTATDGIRSRIDGTALSVPEESWAFTPLDATSPSGQHGQMVQKAVTDAGQLALTGEDYNSVILGSTLLGADNRTIQTGTVFTELGYIPRFAREGKSIPLRIDRGTLMEGTSVAVEVGGKVPAGYESGTIDVRFLSDANGFLMPNPYTDDPNAPRMVRLFIDLALNTDEARANGALAQEILHMELLGTAIVEDGTLNLDAVSVIEPAVLGVDRASGLISFRLEEFSNPAEAPTKASLADVEAPRIKAWVPGATHESKLQPEDSLSVFFSEPLLPSTINSDSVQLQAQDGTPLDASLELNGSTILIDPESPLQPGDGYSIVLDPAITDLAGNTLASTRSLAFSLPDTDQQIPDNRSPLALTTLPGYPCTKTFNVDLDAREQGRCLGGITLIPDTTESDDFGTRQADDILPIMPHGAEQPLIVRFSQAMDPDSIRKDDTVVVEERVDGEWENFTDYHLEIDERSLRIIPFENWAKGRFYRYSLVSGQNGINSRGGLPLQTFIIAQSPDDITPTSGGLPLTNYFIAQPSEERVLTPLSNLPTRDVNSNLSLDAPEQAVSPDGDGNYSSPANAGKVLLHNFPDADTFDGGPNDGANAAVDSVNIGCPAREDDDDDSWEDCPADKFIYQTARLDVEVLKGEAGNAGEVPVKLHPSVLFASGLKVHIYSSALTLLGEDPHQVIPTGPMVMRMRYEGEDRDELISGTITRDGGGQLMFETELDVYLDNPFMDPEIPLSDGMNHNLRSFRLDNLKLRGPITFFDDGRMQIEQRNTEPVLLEEVTVTGMVAGLVDATTIMDLVIPEGELFLNYVSPYTQE